MRFDAIMTLEFQIQSQRNTLTRLARDYKQGVAKLKYLIEKKKERFESFSCLPDEIQQHILLLLPSETLFALAPHVSKAFYAAYRTRKTALMAELQPGRLLKHEYYHLFCRVMAVKRQKNGVYAVCRPLTCCEGTCNPLTCSGTFKRLVKISWYGDLEIGCYRIVPCSHICLQHASHPLLA